MDEDTGLLRASVAYPLSGDGARTRLLFGGVLQLLAVASVALAVLLRSFVDPVLVVPVVFVVVLVGTAPLLGYVAATVRAILEDEDEPPSFGDWSALLRDGRRMALVVGLYALPTVAFATAAVALGVAGSDPPTAALAAAGVAALLALLAAYLLPAAALLVVESGETSRAFDRAWLREAVVDRRYLGPWLLGVGVAGAGGAVGAALSVVVVGFGVMFAAQTAAVHAASRGLVHSLELTLEEPPAPPASGHIPGWNDGAERKELTDGRLGGSLLPTTPDEDDDDEGSAGETPPTPGSATPTGTATDLDRSSDAPGAASSGSAGDTGGTDEQDIEPYEESTDELDRKRDGE
jgi:hypothetical protein